VLIHNRITPTTVNDREGWLLAGTDADGTFMTLAWQASTGETVIVSGHNIATEELRRVAESLIVVDEATWKLANPGYTEPPS
jgi:hypothetical protein